MNKQFGMLPSFLTPKFQTSEPNQSLWAPLPLLSSGLGCYSFGWTEKLGPRNGTDKLQDYLQGTISDDCLGLAFYRAGGAGGGAWTGLEPRGLRIRGGWDPAWWIGPCVVDGTLRHSTASPQSVYTPICSTGLKHCHLVATHSNYYPSNIYNGCTVSPTLYNSKQ